MFDNLGGGGETSIRCAGVAVCELSEALLLDSFGGGGLMQKAQNFPQVIHRFEILACQSFLALVNCASSRKEAPFGGGGNANGGGGGKGSCEQGADVFAFFTLETPFWLPSEYDHFFFQGAFTFGVADNKLLNASWDSPIDGKSDCNPRSL